eukprot:GILJ01026684.1.p1 GENE.GILJ01026684.1~~GILJ01026684.1.p1  ORF type:complete len:465 (+),score=31.83 GILJ01026684.1:1414-2808(+)
MHNIEQGLFKEHLLSFIRDMITEEHGENASKIFKQIDERARSMPPFPGIIRFSSVFDSPARTAREHRSLMKQIVFLIDGTMKDVRAMKTLVLFLQIYAKLNQRSFSNEDLLDIDGRLRLFAQYILCFRQFSKSNLRFLKLHLFLAHTTSFIREFGCPSGYCTETYESFHVPTVKRPYRMSNKRPNQIVEQIVATNRRQIALDATSKTVQQTVYDVRQAVANSKLTHDQSFRSSTPQLKSFLFSCSFEALKTRFDQYLRQLPILRELKTRLRLYLSGLPAKASLSDLVPLDSNEITVYRSFRCQSGFIVRSYLDDHENYNAANERLLGANRSLTEPSAAVVNFDCIEIEVEQQSSSEQVMYGQVILLFNHKVPNAVTVMEFALIRWFDCYYNGHESRNRVRQSRKESIKHGCPYLRLTNNYQIIEISAVRRRVHIVPDYNEERTQGYYLNVFVTQWDNPSSSLLG